MGPCLAGSGAKGKAASVSRASGTRGFTPPTGWSSAFLTYEGWMQVRGASGWTARGFRVEKLLGKCQELGALRDDGDDADRDDKDDGLLATPPLFHTGRSTARRGTLPRGLWRWYEAPRHMHCVLQHGAWLRPGTL